MLKCGFAIWLLIGVINQRGASAPVPDPPAPFVRFTVKTDNRPAAQIAGVIMPAHGKARGTLILCHGWGRRKENLYGWDWIRRELKWNLVLFDFREHGQSTRSRHLCSLGYHEIWDVKAVIDHAQQQGLAGPYAVCGYSLGGSVALRWAAHDPRVKGALAVSPYRNGFLGARQFLNARMRVKRLPLSSRTGFGKMLKVVDLPTDVQRRNDLRIWIMVGEHDIFPESDQRAILDSSPSPQSYKRLFVVPNGTHNSLWWWKGDANVPSHDRIIRDFLDACASGS